MNERLVPLLIVLLVWAFTGLSRGKKGGKNTKGARPTPPRQVGAGGAAQTAGKAPEARGGVTPPRPEPDRGSLTGSLPVSPEEGTDPCHDDYRAMPVGSLSADTGEGDDPCHDDMKPAAPHVRFREEERKEASGGLDLGWTGNEVVKGFVYGEILKRRNG